MLIGAALLLCILSVPLLGGRLQALADLEFRRGGFAVAALVIQIVIISILPGDIWGLSEEIHLATYFLLGAFLVANRHIPGLLVDRARRRAELRRHREPTAASCRPTRTRSRRPASPHKAGFTNSAATSDAPLGFLGDVFHTPAWLPIHNVFSVGDIEIVIGAFLLLHFVCRSRLVHVPFRLRTAEA